MGSFLQTCCVSNQIIDKAYIIPIVVKHERSVKIKPNFYDFTEVVNPISTICYPHDLFKPLGFMFTGDYTDYGRFNIAWNTNLEMFKQFIKHLKENACITLEGENSYHDLPFYPHDELEIDSITKDNAQEIFEKLQIKIDKCSVYLKGYSSPLLLKFSHINQYVGDEIETIYKDHLINDSWFSSDPVNIKRLNATPEEVLEEINIRLKNNDFFDFLYFLNSHESVHITNMLLKIFDTGSFNLDTITLLRKLKAIITGLDIMNVGLKPNIYGNQCYNNEQGRLFSKLMDKVKEHNTKYEYEEEDE